jgi:hypothetical protein
MLFHIDYLDNSWMLGRQKLLRAERLYTARNYQIFLETFRENFPEYVYSCPFRGKEVISAPLTSVRQVYVPRECLRRLARFKSRDGMQTMALDLVELLSADSGVDMNDFGIHGSLALNMHTPKSDIDLVVYGSQNFRRLEITIRKLVEAGTLTYIFNNRLDATRRYRGRYLNKVFMYNATRKPEEINSKYGVSKYVPLASIRFYCKIRDDSEAMFRPAIYKIQDYERIDTASSLGEDKIPELVVSMVGCYRNVARKGDRVRVSGMLERVENLESGQVFHQVVVGTGISEEEHIWPL